MSKKRRLSISRAVFHATRAEQREFPFTKKRATTYTIEPLVWRFRPRMLRDQTRYTIHLYRVSAVSHSLSGAQRKIFNKQKKIIPTTDEQKYNEYENKIYPTI
jgi:hypothetical protein